MAKFNQPSRLVLDRTNTLYIADSSNHCIRKINSQGIISTLAYLVIAVMGIIQRG